MVRDLMDDWLAYFEGNDYPIMSDLKSHGYKTTLDLPIICIFETHKVNFRFSKEKKIGNCV